MLEGLKKRQGGMVARVEKVRVQWQRSGQSSRRARS